MIMDSISLLICVLVFVFSGGILLFISLFGVKEKSYDDILAERRALIQGTVQIKKNQDKKNKSQKGPKKKDKERPHVQIVDTPIIADPQNKKQSLKKNNKKAEVHPILLNKEEGGKVNEIFEVTTVLPANHFEQIHPKDEVELHTHLDQHQNQESDIEEPEIKEEPKKVELKVKESKNKKQESKNQENKKSENNNGNNNKKQEPKQEIPKQKDIPKPEKIQENQTKDKKLEPKKSEDQKSSKQEKANNKQQVNQNEKKDTAKMSKVVKTVEKIVEQDQVVEAVKESVNKTKAEKLVEASEIIVKEVVQNTQASVKDKKKKKSEINALQQLQNGVDLRGDAAVNALISQVRKSELSKNEIQLLINMLLNKQLEAPQIPPPDWSQGRADPMMKLKKQLAEKERALATEQETCTGLQARLRDLRQELNAEKASNGQLQRQLEDIKMNNDKRLMQLTQQFRQREDLIRQQKSEENRRLEIIRNELDSYRSAHQQMAMQLHQRDEEKAHLENEKKNLIDQIESIKSQFQKREIDYQSLENEFAKLSTDRSHYEIKLKQVSDLYEQELNKNHQQINEINKLKIDLQKLENQNQNSEKILALETIIKDQKDDFKFQLDKKTENIKNLESEISRLQKLIEAQNHVHELNLQNKISTLKTQSETEIKNLKAQIEEQRAKNDDLRKKNWKVMEALNNAESALKNSKNSQTNNDNKLSKAKEDEIKVKLIQRLFPDIKNGDENEAVKIVNDLRNRSNTIQNEKKNENSTDGANTEVEKLKLKLSNYQKILIETEKMLQNLENHIKLEEKKWRNEIFLKDFEINSLRDQLAQTDNVYDSSKTTNLQNGQSHQSKTCDLKTHTSNGLNTAESSTSE